MNKKLCLTCSGEIVLRRPSEKRKFCSRKCYGFFKKGKGKEENMPTLIKKYFYIYPSQITQIETITKTDNSNGSMIIRQALDYYLKKQLYKKGFFSCQSCGKQRKNKERHEVRVEEDTYVFGDCCYFNDSYKTIIHQLL